MDRQEETFECHAIISGPGWGLVAITPHALDSVPPPKHNMLLTSAADRTDLNICSRAPRPLHKKLTLKQGKYVIEGENVDSKHS